MDSFIIYSEAVKQIPPATLEHLKMLIKESGFGENEASKIFAYDANKDTWSSAVEIPRTVRLAGFTAQDKSIFIIGGGNSREIFTDILVGTIMDGEAEQNPK